ELGGEDLREVGVEERGAVRFPEADRGAAAVTAGAELHLALLRGAVGEALGGIAERRSWGSIVFRGALVRSLGPGQVRRGGAVAALAADAQGVPRRVVGLRGIVAAAKAGRVAFDAHEVGVLLGAGPMEPVAVVHPSAVVEVDPAPRAHVPGGAVSLEATVRQAQEVLLEGIDAERVGDPILRQLSVRARRVDPEGAVTAEEAVTLRIRGEGVCGACGVAEVAEHRLFRGELHRPLVIGAAPGLDLRGVTRLAGLFGDPRGPL